MDARTIERLNAYNHSFYHLTAADFDATRQRAWEGWVRLLPMLAGVRSVLDVGCGNGRLAHFLAEHLPKPIVYHGVDLSADLLARARKSLATVDGLSVTLEARDLVQNPPDSGTYDLVALMAVLHHIPARAQREALVRALAARVSVGGLLVFSSWRFMDVPRLAARVVPFPDDLAPHVEPGDYLLDWRRGTNALRYCHSIDADEQAALMQASSLEVVAVFDADGENGRLNGYSVLRRV